MIRIRTKPLFFKGYRDPFSAAMFAANGMNQLASQIAGVKSDKLKKQMYEEQMRQQHWQFTEQMAYNNMDWKRNYDASKEFFDLENRYNSPAAQARRYEAAGLNPALMMNSSPAVGQIDATSPVGSPSPGSMPGIPEMSGFRESLRNNVINDAYSRYQDSRLKEEQIEQLGIDTEFKRSKITADLLEQYARIEKIYEDKNTSEMSRKMAYNQLQFLIREIRKMDATWDYDITQSEQDARFKTEAANEQFNKAEIARIEANFKEEEIKEGIRSSVQQRKESAQRIKQMSEEIRDMFERRQDDFKTSNEVRKEIKERARKLTHEIYNINPDTPEGRKRLELLEAQLLRELYGSDKFTTFDKVREFRSWKTKNKVDSYYRPGYTTPRDKGNTLRW